MIFYKSTEDLIFYIRCSILYLFQLNQYRRKKGFNFKIFSQLIPLLNVINCQNNPGVKYVYMIFMLVMDGNVYRTLMAVVVKKLRYSKIL